MNARTLRGCIDFLSLNGRNLVDIFGLNEYALFFGDQHIHRRNPDYHYTQKYAMPVKDKGRIVVEGILVNNRGRQGGLRFRNIYQETKDGLKILVERMYTRRVRVFDDSVCFICLPGWYTDFRIFTPSDIYYSGYHFPYWDDSKIMHMTGPLEVRFNRVEPLSKQNLYSEAVVGCYAEIFNDRYGLRFKPKAFSAGEHPIQRVVQPRARSYVEYEFQFDVLGWREPGTRQMLDLLIKPWAGSSEA